MKPTRSLHFLASSIAALTVAHTASGIDYDTNTTITGAVPSSTGVRVGVLNSNVTLTVDNGGALNITAGSIDVGSGTVLNEALVVNGTGTLTMIATSGKNINFQSGSGQSITVQGGGTMALTAAPGVTSSGTLYMGSSSAAAPNTLTVTGSGSTFTNGDATWGANIWLAGSNSQIIVSNGGVFTSLYKSLYIGGRWGANTNNSLSITGAGSKVTTNSSISLNSAQGDNSSYMALTISSGGVASSASGNISSSTGSNNNTATITGSGSLWNLNGGILQLGNHASAQNNTLNVSNGGSLNNVGSVLMNGTNNQFNLGSGGAALLSTATVGTVTLGSSGASLNIDNGRLIARADGTLASGAGAIVLNGPAYLSTAFAGSIISSAISGSGTLVKEGAGTLTLNSAAAAYSGSATITEGTLALTSLTVGSGKILKGAGSITGNVTVNDLGTLAPGTSIESLAMTGDLAMNDGATFAYEVNSTTVTADLQKVTGNVALESTGGKKVYLTLSNLGNALTPFETGTKFSLINYTGTLSGGFFYGATALGEGGSFNAGLNKWTITYNDADGGSNFAGDYAGGADKFINLTAGALTAIPEPGSLLALGCLVGSGVLLRSRRRA